MTFAPLESARLRYRRLEPADAPALARLGNEWAVARHTARVPHPLHESTAGQWITACADAMAAGTVFTFGLAGKTDNALIGTASLAVSGDQGEVGYWLGIAYWGQGLATEAVHRLAHFGFETLGLGRLWAGVHPDNRASARVLEKTGMHRAGSRTMPFSAAGKWYEADLYEIGRDPWAARAPEAPPGPPLVYVGAAALLDDTDCVLMAARPEGKDMAGLWEFPGGKVLPGEGAAVATARELDEELGLTVTVGQLLPFAIASHRYPRFHLLMPLFVCRSWLGTPRGREGQALRWVAMAALDGLPVPPADRPLVATLRRRF